MTGKPHPLSHLLAPPRLSPEPAWLSEGAVEIMRSYTERIGDFAVAPDIAPKIERRIRKRANLADWEVLVAVVDATVIGDGRNFMAFTNGGLHVKEAFFNGLAFQPWDRILRHRADSALRRSSHIRIGEHIYWPTGTGADLDELALMIDELGGWALLPEMQYDAPRVGNGEGESITTVAAAGSLDELIESVYLFTYGWDHVMTAPTIKRVDADPVRARLDIPADQTVLAIFEFPEQNDLALTEHGLFGRQAGGDSSVMRPWERVRAQLPLDIDSDESIKIDGANLDLASVWLDHDDMLDLLRFVALRTLR